MNYQMQNPMMMQVNPYMYMPMAQNMQMAQNIPMGNMYMNPMMQMNPMMMNPQNNMNNMMMNPQIKNNINVPKKSNTPKRKNEASKISNEESNVPKRIPSARRFVEYTPYTLKDYKELTSTNVVMGPLGANIGTDEWKEKKEKMKRMENYSNRINQTHQGLNRIKKDTPKDEIEKNLRKQKEESHRTKTYEYGKLIRSYKANNSNAYNQKEIPGQMGNDILYNDLGVINENEEMNIRNNMTNQKKFNPKEDSIQKTMSPGINEGYQNEPTGNIIGQEMKNISGGMGEISSIKENENEKMADIERLLQEREMYKAKINDIKDSLL